jgi:plasmid stabilization system protein ParE
MMGEARPELGEDIRSFHIGSLGSHAVFYRPLADGIVILTVVHTARDLPAALRMIFQRSRGPIAGDHDN